MKNILLLVLVTTLFLTACSSARQKLTPQGNLDLKSANVYYAQSNVEKAFDYYNRVLKTNPEYLIALKRIADINLRNGETSAQKVEYNKNAYIYYDKTLKVLASFPELNEADKAMKREVTKKKEGAWVRIFTVGRDSLLALNYTDALKTMETLYNLDKTRIEPLKLIVSCYQELKDDANVALYLAKILEINPGDADIIKMMGSHYFNKKDYVNAVEYFNKTKTVAPRDVNNLQLLATCYYEMKQYPKALSELKQVLIIEPGKLEAIYDARLNAAAIPDVEETIFYAKLLAEKDKSTANLAFLVVELNGLSRFTESMPYAEMLYEIDTTSSEAVSLCLFVATQLGNKELIAKYENIQKTLN